MIGIAAAVAAAVAVLAARWGLRLLREIEEIERLSATTVGPPSEIGERWPDYDDDPPAAA